MRTPHRLTLLFAIIALVLATPAFAGVVIEAGPDLWQTRADGDTRVDFVLDPIPANFFCPGSEPYVDVIAFKGVPLTTRPAGVLGTTDTLVQRLDDAVFDADGRAFTRVQVQAMEFEGMAPVKTNCGTFAVRTVLDGEQPITDMEIRRLRKTGGVFIAPISVNVRMIFTPLDARNKGQVEIAREMRFAPMPNAVWATKPGPSGVATPGNFLVDTNADGEADTWYSGTPGFVVGWALDGNNNAYGPSNCHCEYNTCGHQHCTAPPNCPPFELCEFEPQL
ncbi:MAG: hypothetical protein AAF481_08870 [Acidobacteriota bacterium]